MKDITYNEVMHLDITHPNQTIYVLFGHDKCGYCPYTKLQLDFLKEKEGSIEVFYCDTMQNFEAVKQFNITSVPFTILIKKGEVVASFTGGKTASEYKEILRKYQV